MVSYLRQKQIDENLDVCSVAGVMTECGMDEHCVVNIIYASHRYQINKGALLCSCYPAVPFLFQDGLTPLLKIKPHHEASD